MTALLLNEGARFFAVLFGLRFYRHSLFETTFGDIFFVLAFLLAALLDRRPPVAPSFVARRKIGEKGVPKGSKAALWILAFYTGVRRGDVRASYEFAQMQLTRFRPVASSQTPYPSFCLSGQKLSHSVAPPFPTKPTSLGFGGAPFLHCFHGLDCTAPGAAKSLAL